MNKFFTLTLILLSIPLWANIQTKTHINSYLCKLIILEKIGEVKNITSSISHPTVLINVNESVKLNETNSAHKKRNPFGKQEVKVNISKKAISFLALGFAFFYYWLRRRRLKQVG